MKIMGDMSSVLSAVHLVLSSNSPEEEDGETSAAANQLELRMLIPEEVVGAVIGKGGKNIKDIKKTRWIVTGMSMTGQS